MRAIWKWALVVAVLAVPVGSVAAQQPDEPIPEGTTVQLLLLKQKSVQAELKLGPEFAKKLNDFINKECDDFLEALKLKGAAAKKKIEELEERNKKFIEDNLNAKQRKRLDEIYLQVTGLTQLQRPDVAKALKLTDDQQSKFKDLQTEARKKLQEIIEKKEGRNENLAKLRKAIATKISAILTDEQRTKVRELVGEPFTGELLFEEYESKEAPVKKLNPPPGPQL
jgi:hypothetical protein